MSAVSELITRRKAVLGLSDRELGRRMRTPAKPGGISDAAVATWRTGESRPTQVPPEVIAGALEVSPREVYEALGVVPDAAVAIPDDSRAALLDRVLNGVDRLASRDLASLLDFTEFLAARAELRSWSGGGSGALAELYSDDEPEYSIADHRP